MKDDNIESLDTPVTDFDNSFTHDTVSTIFDVNLDQDLLNECFLNLLNSKRNNYPDIISFAENFDDIFLDESRRKFLKYHEECINSLEDGLLNGRNRFRQILLGTKASGKTKMLEIIQDYMKARNSDKIIVLKVVYGDAYGTSSLLDDIIFNLRINFKSNKITEKVKEIEEFLIENDQFLLLLIDEFQEVYRRDELGKRIISEVHCLSDTNKGRIHMIVSGSGSELRKLAFCNLHNKDIKKYNAYTGMKLNITKLQPY